MLFRRVTAALVALALAVVSAGCASAQQSPQMIVPIQTARLSNDKGALPDGLSVVNGVIDCDPTATKVVITKGTDYSSSTKDEGQRLTQLHWPTAPNERIELGIDRADKPGTPVWGYDFGVEYLNGESVAVVAIPSLDGFDTPALELKIPVAQQVPTEIHLCRMRRTL